MEYLFLSFNFSFNMIFSQYYLYNHYAYIIYIYQCVFDILCFIDFLYYYTLIEVIIKLLSLTLLYKLHFTVL